jgi:hypothetical protein
MDEDPTEFVIEVVGVTFFAALHREARQVQFHRELEVVVDFDTIVRLEVPAKAFESYDKNVGKFVQIGFALSPYLFAQDFRVVHIFSFQEMRFGEPAQGINQIFPIFDIDHKRQEGLFNSFDFRAFFKSSYLLEKSSTNSLVLCLGADALFNLVHEGDEEFIGILLVHRYNDLSINFDRFYVFLGEDRRADAAVETGEYLFELEQLDGVG